MRAGRQILAGFISATVAHSVHPRVLTALCVLAANAAVAPRDTLLPKLLAELPQADQLAVGEQWRRWSGPVRGAAWSVLLGDGDRFEAVKGVVVNIKVS